MSCPYKETTACGADCAMHELPNTVGSEVASWKPNPCQGTSFFKSSTTTNSCNFLPNMAKCFKILFMLTFCDNSD